VIQWTDDLAIGIGEIDTQHQELYRAVSALREAMREHRLERVVQTVAFLEGYAVHHFAAEERRMEAAGYPGLIHHRSIHREFAKDFLRRKGNLASVGPTPSLVVEMSSWLGEWLRDHVRGLDAEMGRFLRARSPFGT